MTAATLYTLFEELFLSRGALAAGLVFVITAVIIWRTNKGTTPYRLGDALIDPMTGKGSLLRTMFFVSGIASWAIVFFYVAQGQEIPASVSTTVLSLLGIFVTPMIIHRVAENSDPRVKAEAANTSAAIAAAEAAKAVQPASPPPPGTMTTVTATATTEGTKP